MKHIRHSAIIIAGLVVSVLGSVAAAPAAFAMQLRPPVDSAAVTVPIATGSGMSGWEVTLIAVSAALFAAAATALALRLRFQGTPRPVAA